MATQTAVDAPRVLSLDRTPSIPAVGGTPLRRTSHFRRACRSWLIPYLRSRLAANEFRPVLSFFYTDLNCNLACSYCYSRGKNIPGMSWETARAAVDWLERQGCRVLAYMGGEPLVRKSFIVELTRLAAQKGFFVYLPTNGILMDRDFIDAIGEAGVAAVNLAVDAMDGYAGIPKNLKRILPQFEYLVEQEKRYGYHTFLNINITGKNVDDVMALTETAHRYGIATDYHISEPPPIDYEGFDPGKTDVWIHESQVDAVDELIDWLIAKNRAGYTMVNSVAHLEAMKRFIRRELPPWPCQAGRISMVIRLDGSFTPCFEYYASEEDWGDIRRGPRFDEERLERLKARCSPGCLSTCNFQVSHYSQSWLRSLQWVAKHAYSQFFGVS
ncbi:MAG: radical SAM protein [Desulfobacterales bacterium]